MSEPVFENVPEPVFDEMAVARGDAAAPAEATYDTTDDTTDETTDYTFDAEADDPFDFESFLDGDEVGSGLTAEEVYAASSQAVADQLERMANPEPTLDDLDHYLGDPYDPNYNENVAAAIAAGNEYTLAQVGELVQPLVQAQEAQVQADSEQLVSSALDSVDVGGEFDKALATDLFHVYKGLAVAEHGETIEALNLAAQMAATRAMQAAGSAEEPSPVDAAPASAAPPAPYVRGEVVDELTIATNWKPPETPDMIPRGVRQQTAYRDAQGRYAAGRR
ncbi:MAG TPA: hypothetical protein VIM33_07570 [Gaiellaceae bacterium]